MTQPVVHLELHTGDLPGARAFYYGLCDWRPEQISLPRGSYLAMEMGGALGGGIVECKARRPIWLGLFRSATRRLPENAGNAQDA